MAIAEADGYDRTLEAIRQAPRDDAYDAVVPTFTPYDDRRALRPTLALDFDERLTPFSLDRETGKLYLRVVRPRILAALAEGRTLAFFKKALG